MTRSQVLLLGGALFGLLGCSPSGGHDGGVDARAHDDVGSDVGSDAPAVTPPDAPLDAYEPLDVAIGRDASPSMLDCWPTALPADPRSCGLDGACHIEGDGSSACGPRGAGQYLEECSGDDDCTVYMQCLSVGPYPARCQHFCDLASGSGAICPLNALGVRAACRSRAELLMTGETFQTPAGDVVDIPSGLGFCY